MVSAGLDMPGLGIEELVESYQRDLVVVPHGVGDGVGVVLHVGVVVDFIVGGVCNPQGLESGSSLVIVRSQGQVR